MIQSSAQVELITCDTSVYIYTHTQSNHITELVHTILSTTQNINSPDIVASEIYDELKKAQEDKIAISSLAYTSTKMEVWLNFDKGVVTIVDTSEDDVSCYESTFEEFIQNFTKKAEL